MPEFRYRGRDGRGELVSGVIEADAADAVARQLGARGITPVEIDTVAARSNVVAALRERMRGSGVRFDDLLLFSRQMHSLTRAGVPLTRGLRNLAQSARSPTLQQAILEIIDAVESGRSLAAAFSQHPRIFPPLFVNIVRVGEESGRLDDSFLRLYEYLQREKETRQQIRQAVRYPAFVVVAIAAALAVVTLFVIPAFAEVFQRADIALPWATRTIMAVSQFLATTWALWAAALVAGALWARWWVQTERGHYQWDRLKLRLPLVGDIIRRGVLGRYARAFSICYSAGVPLVQALSLVAEAVDNAYVGAHVRSMRAGVERGEGLTHTAQATGLFTPLVLQMLAVGEEIGSVEDMLREVAEFYEREVEYDVRNLTSIIEPLLLLAMGALVLILALGVFLPMWDLTQLAQ